MTQHQETPLDAVTRIRFASEREHFDALSGDGVINQIANKVRGNNEEEANRRRLLATSLRITDHVIPGLMKQVEQAKQLAHLQDTNVETFVYNSPQHAASCMRFGDGDVYLLISSGLYSSLNHQELMFVIGHEFGHVAYDHHRLPARAIMQQKGECDANRALQLMAWSRRAEISADRVGLLCCQDFEAAAKSFIKLSSGLSDELVDFDLHGYVSQVMDLERLSRTVRDLEDLYSTHPFNPIRIAALYRFWHSQSLNDLLGNSAGNQSDVEVDSRIHELLQLMDPNATNAGNDNAMDCLVWGGAMVAASDGRIDQAEVETLAKFANREAMNQAKVAIHSAPDPLQLIRQKFFLAAQRGRLLPAPQRHAIVQQLIAVANASMTAGDQEKSALTEICTAMDISPSFPEKILAQYTDDFFAKI